MNDTISALRQQESLRQVIESISSELELRPLLTLIIRHACELLDVENGTIGLLDTERNVVRTEAAYNMPDGEIGSEMPVGVGIFGHVLAHREPAIFGRYGDVLDSHYPQLQNYTVLGVPIAWHGELIGVFGLGSPPPRQFGTQDIEVLSLFAKHAAIAIENARRYEREHQQTERLVRIARIGHLLTADLSMDQLLQSAADAIHELLGYPNVAIPLLDPDDPETLVIRTFGGFYKSILDHEYRQSIHQGIMGAAVKDRAVQLVNDVKSDPRWVPTPHAVGIIAELALPIKLGSELFGVLNIESAKPFTEEDTLGLRIVADQIATVLHSRRQYLLLNERAQQVAVLEERQRLARELHDSVTQLLFSMTLIAQSIAPAWTRDPEEGERRIARLLELSQNALAEMRALLGSLRPEETAVPSSSPLSPAASGGIVSVRQRGLATALRLHAATIAHEGIEIRADTKGYAPQSLELEETAFRIMQEALNNVVKHARAPHVEIDLRTDAHTLHLSIVDDGTGFALPESNAADAESAPVKRYGLAIMRERAEAVGGHLKIVSASGKGTAVTAALPFKKAGQG